MTDQLNDILTEYALSNPEPSRGHTGRLDRAAIPSLPRNSLHSQLYWGLLVWTADASLLPGGDRLTLNGYGR